jgi:hypothetical protein
MPFRMKGRFEKNGYTIQNELYARLMEMLKAFSCRDFQIASSPI